MFAVALAIGVVAFIAHWHGYIPPVMRPALSPFWTAATDEPPAFTAIFVRSIDGRLSSGQRTLAVRPDGATAEWTAVPVPNAEPVALRRIVSLPDGNYITIVPPLRLLARSRHSQPRWSPASDCTAFADAPSLAFARPLGEERYLGYRAVRVEMEATLTHRTVSWMIPALGCLEARQQTERRNAAGSGPAAPGQTTEERAVRIREGAPEPDYFAIPGGYGEVTPAVLQQRMDAYIAEQCPGQEEPACAAQFLTARDLHLPHAPEL